MERQVLGVVRDPAGDVLAVCDPGQPWSPRGKQDVIDDIRSGQHSYVAVWEIHRALLHVVEGSTGPYLRTSPDESTRNNLDDLPDCAEVARPEELPPVVRRNVATVPASERARLRDAIVELNRRLYPDGVSQWFKQDQIHQATHVHDTRAFLPWHRELLNRFEVLLRQIDPGVALHYWDWETDPRRCPDGVGGFVDLFTEGFMGSADGPIGPPFAGFDNDGKLAGSRNETSPPRPELPPVRVRRQLRAGTPLQGSEQERIQPDTVTLSVGDDKAESEQYERMWRALNLAHGRVHAYIGGNIGEPGGHQAFEDPFIFLLHANVDRLWASWQLRRIGDHREYSWRLDPSRSNGDPPQPEQGGQVRDTSIDEDLMPWSGTTQSWQRIRPWTAPDNQQQVKTSRHRSVVAPPLYDRYSFGDICFSWQAMQLGRYLPDGDLIDVRIDTDAVGPELIEVVLEAAPHITWWKAIRVPDGPDSRTLIQTQDNRTTDRASVPASALHNRVLIFHKAKFLGAHRIVYRLGDLERIPPGGRVTFRWLRD